MYVTLASPYPPDRGATETKYQYSICLHYYIVQHVDLKQYKVALILPRSFHRHTMNNHIDLFTKGLPKYTEIDTTTGKDDTNFVAVLQGGVLLELVRENSSETDCSARLDSHLRIS